MTAMIRSFVESATRSWTFRRTIRAGKMRFPLLVSPSAGLKYLVKPPARVDPTLLALAQRHVRAGDVVWDVGANIGLFTFAAASLAGPSGRVIAFEPDAWLVQLLRRSAALQRGTAPVDVVPAAVAESFGIRSFALARRSRASNHLVGYGNSQTGGVRETHSVATIPLDGVLGILPPPRVLKIDVEGAEGEALRGGLELLRSARPIVLCEVGEASRSNVTELLRSLGYRLFDADLDREIEMATWSTVALPPPPAGS